MFILKMKESDLEKFKKELYKLYIIEGKGPKEISNKYNCTSDDIKNAIISFKIPRRKPVRRKINIGDKINKLTFIGYSDNKYRNKHGWFQCDCENKTIKEINMINVKNNNVKSCGCLLVEGTSIRLRGGYKDISGRYYSSIKCRAFAKNREFSVTLKYLWYLYLKQDRKCKFTGNLLYFKNFDCKKQNASLDRIDSSKGYIECNVQWIDKRVNMMKSTMTDEEFIILCRCIVNNQKITKEPYLG